jgi:hemerythrin-like metal-binding protein
MVTAAKRSGAMSLVWDESLAVGIPFIDEQHRMLIGLAHDLPLDDEAGIGQAVDAVLQYTFEHFNAEEAFMQRIGYPDRAEHLQTHRAFTDQFDSFFRCFNEGQIDYPSFRQFVLDWVRRHIHSDDRELAAFAQSRSS